MQLYVFDQTLTNSSFTAKLAKKHATKTALARRVFDANSISERSYVRDIRLYACRPASKLRKQKCHTLFKQ